jgi:YbbR domain-containing protein
MARSRRSNFRPGLMLLALVIAVFLWGVAQGSTDIKYSFDIPVEIHGVDDSLVVTDQSAVEVNIGVLGSRAALRNLDDTRMKYEIDVSNAKPGIAEFEIDPAASIQLPRRARFASHSPTRVQIRLERKSRKEVSVSPDIQGAPVEGFALVEVRVVPDRVWLAGARSHVMRIAEVQTEPVDISELRESQKVEARLVLGGGTVWPEDETPVSVQIVVEPVVPVMPPGAESLEILDGVPPKKAEEEAGLSPEIEGRAEG